MIFNNLSHHSYVLPKRAIYFLLFMTSSLYSIHAFSFIPNNYHTTPLYYSNTRRSNRGQVNHPNNHFEVKRVHHDDQTKRLFNTPNDDETSELNPGKQSFSNTTSTSSSTTSSSSSISTRRNKSDFGSKGEIFILLQITTIGCALLGRIPLLNNLISFLFGPLLFITGIAITGLGIREMGQYFTAYSKPVVLPTTKVNNDTTMNNATTTTVTATSKTKKGKLITSGIFSYIRNPIYSGNICCLIGLSIMTHSAMRLLLTIVYFLIVEMKSKKEEEELHIEFGTEYQEYKDKVKGKYLPFEMIHFFDEKRL